MNWDEWLLQGAAWVSRKSKDPSTKVGCMIVDEHHEPLSFGYNGFIGGCDESLMTWERPLKYKLVRHAERNALSFCRNASKVTMAHAKMYVTHAPCSVCLGDTFQAKIRFIRFSDFGLLERDNVDLEELEAIRRLLVSVPYANVKHENGQNYLDLIVQRMGKNNDKSNTTTSKTDCPSVP